MLNRFVAIAWKDIYATFKDRNATLIMFAMPVALSLIIGAALGTGNGDVTIDPIDIGIVDLDKGMPLPNGETVALGNTYADVFLTTSPDSDNGVQDITNAKRYNDAEEPRQQVSEGSLAATLIIPEDFTMTALTGGTSAVNIFYDSGLSVGPSVVLSITNAITSGLNTAILAQRVGPAYLQEIGQQIDADANLIAEATEQLNASAMQQNTASPIALEQVDLQGEIRSFDALQYFAPSMAILFMTFAMASGGASILREQNAWTLQRILTTATPRWLFMLGKLAGTFTTGLIQMTVLILATSAIARLMGRTGSVWGSNYAGIALLVLAVTFAGTSLGLLIAAASKSQEQADSYSTVALFILGMLGGSFIPIENLPDVIAWLPKLTLNYWGIQGFFDLGAYDGGLVNIIPNLLALVAIGIVMMGLSLWRFNRRLDV